MPCPLYEAAAGVVVALALIVEAPWLVAFAALSVVAGPIGWAAAAVGGLAVAGEVLARRALPGPRERAALARVRTALWGLAAMSVAFGTTVGAGTWWLGPGHAVQADRAWALRAVKRRALVRVGRVAVGVALVYLPRR